MEEVFPMFSLWITKVFSTEFPTGVFPRSSGKKEVINISTLVTTSIISYLLKNREGINGEENSIVQLNCQSRISLARTGIIAKRNRGQERQ